MSGILQPVPGYAWRPPGSTFGPTHQAVDIPAPAGTPVVAVADGTVRSVGDDGQVPYSLDFSANLEGGQGGIMVTVNHRASYGGGLGSRGGSSSEVVAQYAHLSRASVKVGQSVKAGQMLGAVGATGSATGAHLHFGWRRGSVWEDYRQWLPGGVYSAQLVTAGPATGDPQTLIGYGAGPVQPAPRDPLGKPVGAYPLDAGRSCETGYRLGSVNPKLYGAIPGLWFNRPTRDDGTVLACVRDDLGPGDPANQTVQDALGDLAGTLGGIARNGAFLVGFLLLALVGLYILVKGRG